MRPGYRARPQPTPAATPTGAVPGGHWARSPPILENPRYTGRQVWNRQRTDSDLVDPANVTLGHKSVQRWNLPDGWIISNRPAHPALVSEVDFIAAQDVNATRGPVPRDEPVLRRYLLAGLLSCGLCGRRMESAWSNGKPAYRCRHGHTSAMAPDPERPAARPRRHPRAGTMSGRVRSSRLGLTCAYASSFGDGLPVKRPAATLTASSTCRWRHRSR